MNNHYIGSGLTLLTSRCLQYDSFYCLNLLYARQLSYSQLRLFIMKLIIACLSVLLFLYTSTIQADSKIYKWVDKDGKTHFSDTAIPGTEQISADNKNLMSADALKPNKTTKADLNLTPTQEVIEYKAEITSPQNDILIRSNEGALEIHVQIAPEKESTQKLQLILDGKALGEAQLSPTIRALNIDRGTHQVQVHLLDEQGTMLAKTQIVTVHLQRATAN